MVPMLLMGRWGTPVPHPSPMTVVFGKPIEVPHTDNPTDDMVSLNVLISVLHKASCVQDGTVLSGWV